MGTNTVDYKRAHEADIASTTTELQIKQVQMEIQHTLNKKEDALHAPEGTSTIVQIAMIDLSHHLP